MTINAAVISPILISIEMELIVLDAMGGDNAPAAMIDGAIDAISKEKNVKVILVGIEDVIRKGLEGKTYNPEQIEIVNATEVIETAEPPVHAIRRKKDSSIVVGMKLVKEGKADAFVSAGSSGAILVGGQVIVGRIKGVDRAPLAPLIPTEKGVSLLIDCGNVSLTSALPFSSSAPIFTIPTFGSFIPRTFSI